MTPVTCRASEWSVHNAPHVGRHLQDHYGINYIFKSKQKTLNDVFGNWPGRMMAGMEYVPTQRAAFLSVNQLGGLVKSSASLDRPDTQST